MALRREWRSEYPTLHFLFRVQPELARQHNAHHFGTATASIEGQQQTEGESVETKGPFSSSEPEKEGREIGRNAGTEWLITPRD